jgi:dephospho-CoA kinase
VFRVALTGGIASGKSAAADEFAALGIPVLDTDQIARDVVEPGTSALRLIVAEFGADVLDAGGRLDRRKMRERVFAHPNERKILESITHPAIRAELARRASLATGIYQVHAIPLFVEGGAKGNYDRVLVIDCPEDLQMSRLLQRDGMNEVEARRILDAQATRALRLAAATDVITNNEGIAELRAEVRRLHERYAQLAAAKPN